MYEYKAVPFLAHVGGREPKDAQKAATQLTEAINAGVTGGWEFHQLASVYVEVKPGCLGALTGTKSGSLYIDQLVFRREKA